jgi:hypothetical protein
MTYIPDWTEQPGPYDEEPEIDEDAIADERYHRDKEDFKILEMTPLPSICLYRDGKEMNDREGKLIDGHEFDSYWEGILKMLGIGKDRLGLKIVIEYPSLEEGLKRYTRLMSGEKPEGYDENGANNVANE